MDLKNLKINSKFQAPPSNVVCRRSWKLVFGALLFCFVTSGCVSLKPHPVSQPIASKPYRGVYHVHSSFSPDSKASLPTIIRTAKQAGLDFVIVTDRNNHSAAAAYEKMKINESDPKLFFGVEVTTSDGHLTALGIPSTPEKGKPSQSTIDGIHEQGGYALIAHPASIERPWTHWDVKNFDGLEIYNFKYASQQNAGMSKAFQKMFSSSNFFLKSLLKTPYTELTIWDRLLKERKVIGVAAVDAQISKSWKSFSDGNFLMQFQAVTLYALADELKEKSVLDAVGKGRTFMAFEVFGSARDFSFTVQDGSNVQAAGSEVSFKEGMDFQVKVPGEAEIRLIRDGQIVQRIQSRDMMHKIQAKGTYRVEVYRKGKLWIFTNPIWIS